MRYTAIPRVGKRGLAYGSLSYDAYAWFCFPDSFPDKTIRLVGLVADSRRFAEGALNMVL
jgi:hypothetical protein